MKYLFLIILFFSLNYLFIFPQNIPSVSKGSIQYYVDYSCFRGTDNKSVVEVYLMLYADQLKYSRIQNKENASIKINAVIKDGNEKIIKEQTWTTEVGHKPDGINLKNYVVYDQWRADLIPGKYKMYFKINDADSDARGVSETSLDVPDFNINSYQLSQIEFVNSVENTSEASVFTKGNQNIIPEPARRYGVLNPTLFLYYEIYNIPPDQKGNLIINYSVIDKNNNVVKQYPATTKGKNNPDIAIINGVDVSQIPTGIYKFKVEVNDTSEKKTVETEKYFEVVQLDYVNKNQVFTEEQADAGRNQIKYFATERELEIYNRLNLSGKAQFLVQFWREKDPTPGTNKNEFLEEVQQRYRYANENFSTKIIEGWASDRGRVLIKYGKPDEIENHHFETGTVPYEIWTYRNKKTYEFVFADLHNNGNFILLHSTKEGEISNYNWQDEIQRM